MECQRLWREYAKATTAHIRLESKRKLAELAQDRDALAALAPRVEAAGVTRKATREAICNHEHEFHQHGRAEPA
ncbi:MAG TPA: hypothetical protein VLW65_14725 [Bryobacteraceae bacterium]|nr:hypothetical protein [Bryobacteraceae bacterium]